MKESEFRRIAARELNRCAVHISIDPLVELVQQAGAVFEPEGLTQLPELSATPAPQQPGVVWRVVTGIRGDYLSIPEAAEVIRRCKAVESAVEYCREMAKRGTVPALPMTYGELSAHLLSILEGRP